MALPYKEKFLNDGKQFSLFEVLIYVRGIAREGKKGKEKWESGREEREGEEEERICWFTPCIAVKPRTVPEGN